MSKATVTEIVNVLTPIIKGGGNDVDAKQVQQWVWEAGLIEGMRCAGEIVTMALNSGQNENEGAEGEPSDIEWQRLMEIGLGILGLV